jgi:hypothetical protein
MWYVIITQNKNTKNEIDLGGEWGIFEVDSVYRLVLYLSVECWRYIRCSRSDAKPSNHRTSGSVL